MNVLIVTGSSDLYGANRILLQVMRLMKPRRLFLLVPEAGLLTEFIKNDPGFSHVQIFIVPSYPVVYRKMDFFNGVELVYKILSFRKEVKKIIVENKIHWAFVNTLSCFIIIKIIKLCKVKVITHVHEILENDKKAIRWINKLAMRWSDKIIAVSEAVRLNMLEVGGKEGKIVTILNGIEDKKCTSSKEKKDEPDKVYITLIGRIKPEKGIWFFLDVIYMLPPEVVDKSKFIIVGGAAPGSEFYLKKLEKDIKAHPAKKNIEYKSFIPDVTDVLNSSDIIVVPSLMKDPFPTTILEGLSAGKPVIATRTGGAVQSVKDNITGFLIEPSDNKQFADRLVKLINSPSLRKSMGEQGRKEFFAEFTIDIFEKKFNKEIERFEETI